MENLERVEMGVFRRVVALYLVGGKPLQDGQGKAR